MNERNTLVVSASMAIAFIVFVIAMVVGNTLASQATAQEVKHDSDNLVRCIEAGKPAVDCRTLIYGAK